MKSGIRQALINRVAALMRGGEPWDRARTVLRGVRPSVVEEFRPVIEQLGAGAGPAEKLPVPITEDEEREQLRKWAEDRLPRITAPLKIVSVTRGVRVLGGRR